MADRSSQNPIAHPEKPENAATAWLVRDLHARIVARTTRSSAITVRRDAQPLTARANRETFANSKLLLHRRGRAGRSRS
jgi:hypothetical protein